MKYADLFSKLQSLTNEQLEQTVNVVAADGTRAVVDLWIVEEDHINPTGECAEPVSAYAGDKEVLENEVVCIPKGTVFLECDCKS